METTSLGLKKPTLEDEVDDTINGINSSMQIIDDKIQTNTNDIVNTNNAINAINTALNDNVNQINANNLALQTLLNKSIFDDNLANQNIFDILKDTTNFTTDANGLKIATATSNIKQLIKYVGNVVGKELRLKYRTALDIQTLMFGFTDVSTGYNTTLNVGAWLYYSGSYPTHIAAKSSAGASKNIILSNVANDSRYTNTDIYMKIEIASTSFKVSVYSDANYTNLLGVQEYTGVDNSTLRYFYIYTTDTNATGLQIKNISLKDTYTSDLLSGIGLKRYSSYGKLSGKNVHIYKFGGKGNDWCFVRTPSDYDPNREKPYPFVICNHGNGWTMDGTPQLASWTKRTMYVKASDTDYLASPTQYNMVADNSPLLYSNPTIEALLSAGYIVCGCENYGDNLYGNDNCRQACVDFYYHMVKNYNVEEKCYMIGASNGAMTSLNAMYLLGASKIKAMILQYPLVCLWKHYNGYSAHQSAIESAYGISAGLTEAQFEKATRTHDPEKVCTITNVDGVARKKTIPIPPIKFWYSNGDTTTAPVNNSLPLIQLLEDSNCIYESVVASGNHGDFSHFDPTAYVAWFEKWR